MYCYQKSIRYISLIHCCDSRYVSSILICSNHQDKQVPVLMTGPTEPHFDMCTTSQDSCLVRNGTQSQFVVEWVVLFGQNIKFFSFLAEFKRAEGRTIQYRYPCFNNFCYGIVGKYRYFRYIVYRYTSQEITKSSSFIKFGWLGFRSLLKEGNHSENLGTVTKLVCDCKFTIL